MLLYLSWEIWLCHIKSPHHNIWTQELFVERPMYFSIPIHHGQVWAPYFGWWDMKILYPTISSRVPGQKFILPALCTKKIAFKPQIGNASVTFALVTWLIKSSSVKGAGTSEGFLNLCLIISVVVKEFLWGNFSDECEKKICLFYQVGHWPSTCGASAGHLGVSGCLWGWSADTPPRNSVCVYQLNI